LPDKFHGMAAQEQKYRQRYVDLITDQSARSRFIARSKAVSSIRSFMVEHGFLEVETPMLHPIPAVPTPSRSSPTTTRWTRECPAHRARAVPEALLVGGFERVFEINRQLPQRRASASPQPRIHDDGVLRGVLDTTS
jgi:lysyl-tRNA synthetase class 2